MAGRFYRLKSVEAINETYRKKFEEVQNASAVELAKLGQERDQAKAATENMAKSLPSKGQALALNFTGQRCGYF